MIKRLSYFLIALLLFASCKPEKQPEQNPGGGQETPGPEKPEPPVESTWQSELAAGMQKHGVDYLYDLSALPEIHITVPLANWNALLDAYDADKDTKQQVRCNIHLVKGNDIFDISDAAIRLKGNTSRRRPEGSDDNKGQHHVAGSTTWHQCHFQVNFRKFIKDDAHKVRGAKKVVLKFFNEDPMRCREIYCYDYFHRMNVWGASYASYCRLFLKIEGDSQETYYGVYSMIEPVDDDFLKVRKGAHLYGSELGNLWKCRWGATLKDPNGNMGADLDDGNEYTYELKTNTSAFAGAKSQLQNFISNVNNLSGQAFETWIEAHCDVDLLLKTYAVNVALGMWDDYWNNSNNYYIYFNSISTTAYKFYFIPYDYDNTLGTTHNCGIQQNAGKHDPLNWGDGNNQPLIAKIISVQKWKEVYKKYLLEAVAERDGISWQQSSRERILSWHSLIRNYITNDTGENNYIEDKPASWSSRDYYRLLENSDNNYFKVKTKSIQDACK